MATGGGNSVNEEQILNLTREIGIIGTNVGIVGTKVDNLAEIVREMKRDLATKAEHAALEKRVDELEKALKEHRDNHNEAPYRKWMLISAVFTTLSAAATVIGLILAYHK